MNYMFSRMPEKLREICDSFFMSHGIPRSVAPFDLMFMCLYEIRTGFCYLFPFLGNNLVPNQKHCQKDNQNQQLKL